MEDLNLSGEYTGRYLLISKPGTSTETLKEVKKMTGLNLASSVDFKNEQVTIEAMEEGDGIFLDKIGIAVINASDAEQIESLSLMSSLSMDGDGEEHGVVLEPERVCRAINSNFSEYLSGYKSAVDQLSEKFFEKNDKESIAEEDQDANVEALGATCGLEKTKVVVSPFLYRQPWTGDGIKIAVLDTGLDLNHPDFAGRNIVSKSFVPNEPVQDLHGHGTHCIGVACGPLNPTDTSKPRYGVAYKSLIYAGKVLSNKGSGADGWILAGINWAIANSCRVISMSLGAEVSTSGYSVAYETAARAALNSGCLIIAAAGNGYNKPVSHPANCPSIMAVGALDCNLIKAPFSNITFYPPHGKVDICAPGVQVLSSIPMPAKYGYMSGTSMATPLVAGIAGLFAQKSTANRGAALWARLTGSALALSQPSTYVGAGLVQAPYVRNLVQFPFPKKPIPPIIIPKKPGPIEKIKKDRQFVKS